MKKKIYYGVVIVLSILLFIPFVAQAFDVKPYVATVYSYAHLDKQKAQNTDNFEKRTASNMYFTLDSTITALSNPCTDCIVKVIPCYYTNIENGTITSSMPLLYVAGDTKAMIQG